ncbi:cysteine proteinase [Pleurotus eryngii]|uniref:Cysteine proteinase n=1 Tax=Pleurotus eryngii TaxID=5323 RepID=A0A9P6DFU3_PLEER|nr:cysteine proteinase [Pleurotus eryngii]
MSSHSTQKDAEATYSKAAKAELSRAYDNAYRLYINAAQSFLHLSRQGDAEKDKWTSNARKCVERAEKIKAFISKAKASEDAAGADMSLTPVDIDYFSPYEQSFILQRGARVNGLVFPSWDDSPPTEGGHVASSTLYGDSDGQPRLSEEQLKASPVWRRAAGSAASINQERSRLLPQDILQQIVTDCSVCASISVCLEHTNRFGSNLLKQCFHAAPSSGATKGRHDLKLFFNVIDNTLPYHHRTGALLCMSTTPYTIDDCDGTQSSGPVLWPSFLEKGYMKLMGGYDFPGSNSTIDIHALTGWIPEHIEIKSPGFEPERTWARIYNGFFSGRCMLTLGTGPTEYAYWQGSELLGSHSYAVIDVREDGDSRSLVVLDSWTPSEDEAGSKSKTLEIPWMDVLEVFDGIYVSWDPSMWENQLNFHGMWKRRGEDDQGNTRHLQLLFEAEYRGDMGDEPDEIWILLTRHLYKTNQTSEYISAKVDIEDVLASQMSSSVDLDRVAVKGTYTNSTHVLARTRIPTTQQSGALSIFVSYDGPSSEIGYSVTAYSHRTISWGKSAVKPPFSTTVKGSFILKNSGGNCTCPSYMTNPQYHLRVHPSKRSQNEKSNVTLSMHTSKDIPINVTVVWSQGERVMELTQTEVVMNSGAYSYGSARVKKELLAGDYTVILSAFEPRYLGTFSLKVDAYNRIDLRPIEQEGAGMYSKPMRGAWEEHNAAGGPSFKQYLNNPIFELIVSETTQIMIRLQLSRPSAGVSINVTVYPAPTRGSLGQYATTSGAYNDSIAGVVTPQVSLVPGTYWIIPSTHSASVQAAFKLVIYSTTNTISILERKS